MKQVLKQSYEESLKLETMIKMHPDKTKLYQMSQEIMNLKEKIMNKNEFDMVSLFYIQKTRIIIY